MLFWLQQEIEWVVLWEALIRFPRGSSQNIVIILLVFPAVRKSLRDYLRIYSGKYLLMKIYFTLKIKKFCRYKRLLKVFEGRQYRLDKTLC